MLLSSLFITFLLEYFLTPTEDILDKYLSKVANWIRYKVSVEDGRLALLTWLLMISGSSLTIWVLWEVILSDNEIHDFESNLLRRLAGLLYVSDIECGNAKKRAKERLKAL